MISLETAKRLKEAKVEPFYGVFAPKSKTPNMPIALFMFASDARGWAEGSWTQRHFETRVGEYYLPDQLLAEIEKRGYAWEMGLTVLPGGPMMPGNQKIGYWCEIFKDYQMVHSVKSAGSRSDAVGEALLWIAERKAGSERKTADAV